MTLYNLKSPAVKRLMKEAEELREPTTEYSAHPLEDNLFDWHFTLRGPSGSEFDGGIYHGRITLPPDYPMKPPSIILLTPNGRFEVNTKICLSISGHHPETWQPSWSIRTALLAIIGFFPTHGNGALGSLDYTPKERKHLATKSQNWKCVKCGPIKDILKEDIKVPDACADSPDRIFLQTSELPQPKESVLNGGINNEQLKIEKIQLNGSENHAAISQSGISKNLSGQESASLTRNRHFTPNQVPNNQNCYTNSVHCDKIKNVTIAQNQSRFNNCSLLMIVLIVISLIVLITRRLIYQ